MGKTHALFRVAEAHVKTGWTVVVMDPKYEGARQTKQGVIVSGPNGADEAVKRGKRLILWQAGKQLGDRPDANAVCTWALKRGAGTLVCIPEAHLCWPNNGTQLPLETVEVLTGFRHRGLAVVIDTQRLSQLTTMARGNFDRARIFGVTGTTDLKLLGEWGGAELVTAVRECARRRREPPAGLGERGHFVDFDPMNSDPPYKIGRFK
jgi:hypothetical protein